MIEQLKSITELKPRDVIVHKGSGEAYIVCSNYGDTVYARRTVSISNPDEWLIDRINRPEPIVNPSLKGLPLDVFDYGRGCGPAPDVC